MNKDKKYENIIFCDDYTAFKFFKKKLSFNNYKILTVSPFFKKKDDLNVSYLEKKWKPEKIKDFQNEIKESTIKIYKKISLHNKKLTYEALIASRCIMKFYRDLYKLSLLKNDDLENERIIINTYKDNKLINFDWSIFLKSNKRIKIYKYYHEDNKRLIFKKNFFYIYQIFLNNSFREIIIKILLKIPIISVFFFNKLLILKGSELSTTIAYDFLYHGYYPINLNKNYKKINNIKNDNYNVEKFNLIKKLIYIEVENILKKKVASAFVHLGINYFFKNLENNFNKFNKNYLNYKAQNMKYNSNNSLLLTSTPLSLNSEENFSIFKYFSSDLKINIISVQEAIKNEINIIPNEDIAVSEINISDYHLTFNDISRNFENNQELKKGIAITYGSSLRFKHLLYKFRRNKNLIKYDKIKPIYVSTSVMRGNVNGFRNSLNDLDNLEIELDIIKNVLNKCTNKITYKPYDYINERYIQNNFIRKYIDGCKNINFLNTKIDMRNLLNKFNIYVTMRATSTVSWLILGNRPLIYINSKIKNPLNKDMYNKFQKSFFVFDYEDENFYCKITNFLNMNIKEIDRLWALKLNDRKNLINELFTYKNSTSINSLIKEIK